MNKEQFKVLYKPVSKKKMFGAWVFGLFLAGFFYIGLGRSVSSPSVYSYCAVVIIVGVVAYSLLLSIRERINHDEPCVKIMFRMNENIAGPNASSFHVMRKLLTVSFLLSLCLLNGCKPDSNRTANGTTETLTPIDAVKMFFKSLSDENVEDFKECMSKDWRKWAIQNMKNQNWTWNDALHWYREKYLTLGSDIKNLSLSYGKDKYLHAGKRPRILMKETRNIEEQEVHVFAVMIAEAKEEVILIHVVKENNNWKISSW